MHFNHYGGPGAQLAAMLVNLTSAEAGPVGAAEVNAALAGCGVRVGEFDEPGAAELLGWARRLRAAFTGDLAARVSTVNGLLADSVTRPYISTHDGKAPHLHYASEAEDPLPRSRAFTAAGVAHLLCEEPGRLGHCRADGCAVVYVDTSRNGRRRFCGTRCANRVRVAEHRARTEPARV